MQSTRTIITYNEGEYPTILNANVFTTIFGTQRGDIIESGPGFVIEGDTVIYGSILKILVGIA